MAFFLFKGDLTMQQYLHHNFARRLILGRQGKNAFGLFSCPVCGDFDFLRVFTSFYEFLLNYFWTDPQIETALFIMRLQNQYFGPLSSENCPRKSKKQTAITMIKKYVSRAVR